jgi:hypothetical protein
LNDWSETIATRIPDCRSALIAGDLRVPVEIGLTARANHIERSERDCLGTALPAIAQHLGPAVRVIDGGPFAGHLIPSLLSALERPKAAIVLTSSLDPRAFERLKQSETTAQITQVAHDIDQAGWPLESMGAGKTLLVISGGGFGLMPYAQAYTALENASTALNQGDFVLVTLETARDSAIIEVTYRDFGTALVSHALTQLGRSEGIEARVFYDPSLQSVRFGGVARRGASIAWNGTVRALDMGAWLDMGAMRLHNAQTAADLHPDFQVHDQWTSQDKAVTLLLLRKF